MTRQDLPLGRRSVLGLMSAVPVAAMASPTRSASASASTASSLRPGGEFDRFVADLAAQDQFSGTVLLVNKNRTVLSRSYGMADKQKEIRNGPDTIYALASVTKMFTAVAILQLVQRGKVALTEKLGTYLDGFPADVADKVTVHQLLTHTSGLGDYVQIDGFFDEAATWTSAEQVMDGTLGYVRRDTLRFAPGSAHGYSNSGYHLLGTIVAQVSGQSYFDYVRDHVFAAAGMPRSDFYTLPQWKSDKRIAHPYVTQPSGQRTDAVDGYTFIGSPATNAFASASDLVRFTRALQGRELLDSIHTELLISPKFPVPPPPPIPGAAPLPPMFETYGPSWKLVGDRCTAGHIGASPGVTASVEWYPPTDWVAVKLSNYDAQASTRIDSLSRELILRH
ncbi:serine hydrolase domain-containing protein [Micromonospora eburnea]|uniref:CubicO group peptidase, beta-lactamase class C family n=1 Tax=Micromonospora eburnea TaxID=227316 RepID=A0A1C6TY37_9ACTN|nr:serine hydrolase domain-containing protein [Micromonospora eburnea]SCL46742.1 CubicO group peptidase, beta-lactamase class C family [Micromonospora eburnea]